VSEVEYLQQPVSLAAAVESPAVNPAGTAAAEELLERLQAAEARIAALELQEPADAAAEDSYRLPDPPEAEPEELPEPAEPEEDEEPKWYDKFTVRGYAQLRWNDVTDIEPGSAPAQLVGDSSVGDNENFLIRRARLVFQGEISEHLDVYIQPDFATTPTGSPDQNVFGQMRDWYGDIYITSDKVHRIRAGQSKLPYGWENMQSSGNRLPLDRNDALNSASQNERDLGIFYYWTPEPVQETFKWISDEGLKGSGNYGMFGIGAYNGQGGSRMEQNDNLHVVARLTYPFFMENGQLVELGMQGYTGKYTVLSTPISPLGMGAPVRPAGTLETGNQAGIRDERLAWTAVMYPQPFGLQCEWNIGRGPALNGDQTEVVERSLHGGYLMGIYRLPTDCYGEFWPFLRYNTYRGGYKTQRNAPYSEVDEWDLGVEWQLNDQVELVSMLVFTDRTNTSAMNEADVLSYGQFRGDLLRFQLQITY
jgi:hypothetical protein